MTEESSGAEVVIVGGGVAGLEALLALRDLAGDRARVKLVSPDPDFVYKPLLVEEPFGLEPAERHELAPAVEEIGAELVRGKVASVDPAAHELRLDDGSTLGYDYLILTPGGRFKPALSGAITFPSPTDPLEVDDLLDRAAADGLGIAFVVPSGVAWALPLYEIVLMTARVAADRGVEVPLTLVTPEAAPLGVFGGPASEAVAEVLKSRGVETVTGTQVEEQEGYLVLRPGDRRLEASAVVALPTMEGPAIDGLPSTEGGFIPIDKHARVLGADDVYAAGDGANFPVKQGGIGTQQADAAAAHIAHALGAPVEAEPFHPVLRGKLLLGDESLSMSHDVGGGGGEGSASPDYLWWPPHKISGRYLAPWLYHGESRPDPEPPEHGLDVEVALPHEWHGEPLGFDTEPPPRVD